MPFAGLSPTYTAVAYPANRPRHRGSTQPNNGASLGSLQDEMRAFRCSVETSIDNLLNNIDGRLEYSEDLVVMKLGEARDLVNGIPDDMRGRFGEMLDETVLTYGSDIWSW